MNGTGLSIERRRAARGSTGFTLIELLVTLALIALMFAIIVPNLGAFVPKARLQGSGKNILRTMDWVRSEAKIQGKRMAMDFDIDHATWRIVFPPEQRLTRDQDASMLEERRDDWQGLESDVVFVGAGDAKNGLAQHGVYRITFDEYGFTGDQMVVLKLVSDPTMLWWLTVHGISGRTTVEESDKGEMPTLVAPGEGSF